MSRWIYRYAVLVLAPLFAMMLCAVIIPSSVPWRWHVQWGLLGVQAAAAVVGVLGLWRLRRSLRRAGGRLCLRCCYDLSGHERESGVCPECGRSYDWESDAKRWRRLTPFDR